MSAAGYQTYVTGKWGIGEAGANLASRNGFDRSYVIAATDGGNYDAKPNLPGDNSVDWYEDGKPIALPKDHSSSRDLGDTMIDHIDAGRWLRPTRM